MQILTIICLLIIILFLFLLYTEAVNIKILLRHLVSVADPDFSKTPDAEEVDSSVKPEDVDKP